MNKRYLIALLLGLLALPGWARDICADSRFYWFISLAPIEQMMKADEAVTKSQFDNCRTVIGGRNNQKGLEKSGLDRASRRVIYRSFREFEQDVRRGRIERDVDVVVYNPEPGFHDTPEEEKRDPVQYGAKFASLARERNLVSVAAPSCRLVRGPGQFAQKFPVCGREIFGPMARDFDFVDIQAQNFQSDPRLYRQLVGDVVNSIRQQGGRAKVIAQLTTSDAMGGNVLTMSKAAYAVADIVDGYWLNVDGGYSSVDEALVLARELVPTLNRQYQSQNRR